MFRSLKRVCGLSKHYSFGVLFAREDKSRKLRPDNIRLNYESLLRSQRLTSSLSRKLCIWDSSTLHNFTTAGAELRSLKSRGLISLKSPLLLNDFLSEETRFWERILDEFHLLEVR